MTREVIIEYVLIPDKRDLINKFKCNIIVTDRKCYERQKI